MPEQVTLHLAIPPELGDAEQILAKVRAGVAAVEAREARKRAETGRHVLGRHAVLRQSWRDSPTSREPRRTLRPTIAARSLWVRLEAIQRKREFTEAYRKARRRVETVHLRGRELGASWATPTTATKPECRISLHPPDDRPYNHGDVATHLTHLPGDETRLELARMNANDFLDQLRTAFPPEPIRGD